MKKGEKRAIVRATQSNISSANGAAYSGEVPPLQIRKGSSAIISPSHKPPKRLFNTLLIYLQDLSSDGRAADACDLGGLDVPTN